MFVRDIFKEVKNSLACGNCEPTFQRRRMQYEPEYSDAFGVVCEVTQTCDLALGGLNLSIAQRKAACLERTKQPNILIQCVELRLATGNPALAQEA